MNSLKNFYARLTNQDYVYDEGNLVGVTCTNKMLDELEGIAIDSLSTQEELETLRASNTIKQANIERLEDENEQLEDKLQEQLCTVVSLLEENAKLIAERDELIHDRDMLKMCADHYEDELKRMHAEREQWMKQEPVAWNRYDSDKFVGTVYKLPGGMYTPHIRYEPLFSHQLPAQQIPEGYANDSKRLDFMISKEAYIGWSRDGEKCALYSNDADEENTLQRLNGYTCFNDPREAIDSAMLSASQPKGELI